MEISKEQIGELILIGYGRNIKFTNHILLDEDREALECWKIMVFQENGEMKETTSECKAIAMAHRATQESEFSELAQLLDESGSPLGYGALGLALLRTKSDLLLTKFLPVVMKGQGIGRCFYNLGLIMLMRPDLLQKESPKLSAQEDNSCLTMVVQALSSLLRGDAEEGAMTLRDASMLSKQLLTLSKDAIHSSGLSLATLGEMASLIIRGMDDEALELSTKLENCPNSIANRIHVMRSIGDESVQEDYYDNLLESLKAINPEHDLINKMTQLDEIFSTVTF